MSNIQTAEGASQHFENHCTTFLATQRPCGGFLLPLVYENETTNMRVANFFFKELQICIVTTSLTLTIYRTSTHLCHAIRLTFRSPSRSFSNINTLLKISNPLASCSSSANIFKSFDFLLLKADLGLSFKPRLCISLKTLDQKTFSERRSIVSFSFQTRRHFKPGSAR